MKVNKIPTVPIFSEDPNVQFTVIIKDSRDNILYQDTSRAGIMCSVESYDLVKDSWGEIKGQQQFFVWGHPAVAFHAYLQLKDWFRRFVDKNAMFRQIIEKYFDQSSSK